jgi:hypothetical protein
VTETPHQIGSGMLARQLRAVRRCALAGMVLIAFYFTTEGTWDLTRTRTENGYNGRFYAAQAEAILHGRLDVDRTHIQPECWYRDNRCYGYFGITPSLVRMPVLGIVRWLRSPLTPLFLGLAVLIGYRAALRLVERALVEFGHPNVSSGAKVGYFIAAALALGPGGSLLFLTRPAVFEEAAAWNVAFFLLALERVWTWHRTGETRHLVYAALAGVAAANARPTAVTACFALGVLVFVLWRKAVLTHGLRRRGPVVAALCLSLLPLATSGGVFWLKFGTPFPDLHLNEQVQEAPFWREILRVNGDRTRGLVFLPTELVAYFRPDGLAFHDSWPYVDFAFPHKGTLWIPPLPRGGAYVEPFTTVTSTMPMAWLVTFAVMVWLVTSGRREDSPQLPWVLASGLLVGAGAMIALTVTTAGLTNRYLSDFFPASVVGLAIGPRLMLPMLGRSPALRSMAMLVVPLLTIWSVAVTVLLNMYVVME